MAMGEPNKLQRVMVSSTGVDLRPYRAAVKDAIERMDQHPVVMENEGAQGTGDAVTLSLDMVEQANVYILLVAWRYGTIPDRQTQSITHQEYEAARRLGKPTFVFLAAPATDGDGHDSPQFPAALRDPDHRQQLDDFRADLQKSHVVDYFTDPRDLETKVIAALANYLIRALRRATARARGVPYSLPPRAPGFVGRADELRDLAEQLRGGQSVGLAAAVAGMAGVGKSALAAEVVYALATDATTDPTNREAFPGGITWVRCDDLRDLPGLAALDDQLLAAWDAALPPETIARAEAASPAAALALREQALRDRLRPPVGQPIPAAALVLLDNVEPELPLRRALETLIPLGIRVLLTSRAEPSVPGLRLKRLGVLDPDAALALFAERYAAAEGHWDEARDTPDARAIVAALGHLPLAIELAAARAGRARSGVAALAAELRAPDVLAKLRDPRDPTASVRYAFEKTVGTDDDGDHPGSLTPTQRARFIALGLPAGPDWPRPLIEAYLDAVTLDEEQASTGADDLDVLIALSLVSPLPGDGPSAPPRLRLHPLLRQYAANLWRHQRETDQTATLTALVNALAPFVAAHAEQSAQAFTILEREEQLITAALTQAAERSLAPQGIVAIVADLKNYLTTGGHWTLGITLRTYQLAACRMLGDRSGEGVTLNNLGYLANSLGDTATARRYYEQALVICREVGDRAGEGTTLNNLGELARSQGQREQARRYYEQALTICREVGDRAREGTTLNNLGALADDLGDKATARSYYEQALVILREVGDRAVEGTTLNNLGTLAYGLGDTATARAYYEQALVICREVGDRAGEGTTLNNLGALAKSLGDTAAARVYYEQALAIFQAIGAADYERLVRHNMEALVPQRRGWWPFGRRASAPK